MTLNRIPYRLALAGGWIDQPFVNRLNPDPFGSMVTVGVEPDFFMMERCGLATGTRKVAQQEWGDELPSGDPAELVRELYQKENEGKAEPSGSQDMVGLIYPGINRLDYRFDTEGGLFPAHIETCLDDSVMDCLESVIWLLPVCPRPAGYSPLGIQNVTPEWVRRLGQSGIDCYDAILAKDLRGLGQSFNECMACWEEMLPQTVEHEVLTVDLKEILTHYQASYPGAMYSGCGGGYLYVVSDEPVPGGFRVRIRRGA